MPGPAEAATGPPDLRRRLATLCAVVLLAGVGTGCSLPVGVGEGTSSEVWVQSTLPPSDPTEPVLGYLSYVTALSREDALRELPHALAAVEQNGSDEDRLWAALFALWARAGESWDARVLDLLNEPAQNPSGSQEELAGLEALLRLMIEERLESTRQIHKATGRVDSVQAQMEGLQTRLDETREESQALLARLEEERKQTRALRTLLDEERTKAKAFEEKLDQLKSIEEIIDRREEPAPEKDTQ